MGKIKELYMDLINSGITPDGLSVDEAVRILKQKENEEGEQYSRLQSGEQENSREA
jgi:hypothetical protein